MIMNKEDLFRQFVGNKPEPQDDTVRLAQKQYERERLIMLFLTEVVMPEFTKLKVSLNQLHAQSLKTESLGMGDFESTAEEARLAEKHFFGDASGE